MLKDSDVVAAKKCVAVLIDSYKKDIWNDARTVNVIAQATHAKDTGLRISTINFFLGNDEEDDDVDAQNEDNDDNNEAVHSQLHIPRGAATKSKQQRKRLQKAVGCCTLASR
jgi:protein SDA1